MCIIVYKPQDTEMPSEETLRSCFLGNPDGAGYMFPTKKGVQIKKGFMSFSAFYNSLLLDYKDREFEPFVMHFRIGTQGGNTAQNTHPFPLSDNIEKLQELNIISDVGIAHNGIIHLTQKYGLTNTSDTMDFITDYLSLIIKEYGWHRGKHFNKEKLLIERLIGGYNKLAIMSKDGHTELIGDFIKDNGCYYSNSSYKTNQYYLYKDYEEYEILNDDTPDLNYTLSELIELADEDPEKYRGILDSHYNMFLNKNGWFDFDDNSCPAALEGDYDWCSACLNYAVCHLGADEDKNFNKSDCIYGTKCSKCKYNKECVNAVQH